MVDSLQAWFIVSAHEMDVTDDYADMHITQYKLVSKEILSAKYKSNISDLRWITARDYKPGGGQASGVLIMGGGEELAITYNWMGVNTPESCHDRKTYTVRVGGAGVVDYMKTYIKKIIQEEGRPATGIVFDFVKEIEPWRCLESRWALFFRGVRYDVRTLLFVYKYRFKQFWNDTLPNEKLISSWKNKVERFNIMFRKRKEPGAPPNP